MRKETLNPKDFRMQACMVLYVTFWDGNNRTFWSGDARYPKYKGNMGHWYNHLNNLAMNKWSGNVKEYAIFRASNGERIGDPVIKVHN